MDPESSYTVLHTDGKQVLFFTAPARWTPSVSSCTLDPRLDKERVDWVEVWRFSRPGFLMVIGWAIGVACGTLGLVWALH